MSRYRYPRSISTFNAANLTALAYACDFADPMFAPRGSDFMACVFDENDNIFQLRLFALRNTLNKTPIAREEFVQRYLYGLIQR